MIPEWVSIVQAFGPYFVGIVGFLAAYLTFRFVDRRKQQSDWERHFLENYLAFWTDEHLVKVRYWIAIDSGYETIQPLLMRRCEQPKEINEEDSKVLEAIDRFCARLAAYDVVDKSYKHSAKRIPWVQAHRSHWSKLIANRRELTAYIGECWPNLLGIWVAAKGGSPAATSVTTPAKPELGLGGQRGIADGEPDSGTVLKTDLDDARHT